MLIRAAMGAFFALMGIGAAIAQNSFPTPGGATVPGYVNMCITGNLAVPCNPSGGGAAYTGPGDVVAGAAAWWGLRAYSSAKRGTNVANVCLDSAPATCVNMVSDASTGKMVIVNVGGSSCATVTCRVATLYDQSGALFCGGAACDLVQATNASRPVLTVSCNNALPCMQFTTAQSLISAANFMASAQPGSASAVGGKRTSTTAYGDLLAGSGATIQIGYSSGANTGFVYNGVELDAAMTDANLHSIQVLFNGASSNMFIDGTSHIGNAGANGFGGDAPCMGCTNGIAGQVLEGGVWAGDKSASFAAMNANQTTFWGPF